MKLFTPVITFEGAINPKQFDLKDSFLLKELSNSNNHFRIFANEFYLGRVKTYMNQERLYYKKNKDKTSQQ